MRVLLTLLISIVLIHAARSQNWDLVYGNVTKEQVIGATKLAILSGENSEVDLIRIDHVGVGSGHFIPLMISSRYIVLDIYNDCEPIKLTETEMSRVAEYVQASNTKISEIPNHAYGTIRVTYRINKTIGQYFIGDVEKSIEYFKQLRDVLYELDPGYYPITTYYRFLGNIGFWRRVAIQDEKALMEYRSIYSDSLLSQPKDAAVSFPIKTFLNRKMFLATNASRKKCGTVFWILPMEMKGLVTFVGPNPYKDKRDSLSLIVEKHDCGKKGFGNSQYVLRGDTIAYSRKFEVMQETNGEYLVKEESFNFHGGNATFLQRSKRVINLKDVLLYNMPRVYQSSKSGAEYRQIKLDLELLLNPK